jgi:hypothetical protein
VRTAEPQKPSSGLEIGLPKEEYSGESRILWEQSVHVDLAKKTCPHAMGPRTAGNMVSVCVECDWRMALMFRRRAVRLRYQGREITAYSVHEFEPEDANVRLRDVAAFELRFLAEHAA